MVMVKYWIADIVQMYCKLCIIA